MASDGKRRTPRLIILPLLLALFAALSSAAYADEVHECGGIVFETPLEGEIPHDLAPGTYYLTGDCYILRHVDIYGEVSICLNGHSVEVEGATTFHPRDGGVLNFYDCSGEGVVGYVAGRYNNHPITVDPGGTANIYGGHFYALRNSNAINSEGTVNIYGGIVESATDGHCAVRNNGVLNIYGGTVIGCDAVWQREGGTIRLAGDDFVLSGKNNAMKYVWDENTCFEVTAPLYMWRTAEDAEFVSSEDEAFEPVMGMAYVEFAPMRGEVTLDYTGGKCETELAEYLCGEATALPADPVREGYIFAGWQDASGALVTEISADARGAQAFTAVWEEIPAPSEPPEVTAAPVYEPVEQEAEKQPNIAPVVIAIAAAVCGAGTVIAKKKKR